VDPRRLLASLTLVALVTVACGCSSSSGATPAAERRTATPTAGTPRSTTTVPVPSATPTTVPVAVPHAPGWTQALTTLPPGGGFTSVSCFSDTLCVAAGGGTTGDGTALVSGSGVAMSWDGATWSAPSVYYPAPAAGAVTAPVLPTLTCTSGPLCLIVDGSGHLSSGDGTNWSEPLPLGTPPVLPANSADPGPGHPGSRTASVSCSSPALCAVVDNTGHTYTLRNGAWVAPQSFGATAGFGSAATRTSLYQGGRVGVSCPTTTSCTAVVGTTVLDWNGSSWSAESTPWASTLAADVAAPVSIACPTVTLCAIVNGDAIVVRNGGKPWTSRQTLDPGRQLDSISCPSRTFCIAADDTGAVMLWNGSTWTGPQQVVPAAAEYPGIGVSVSCPNPQFCLLMNADGDYATYSGQSPTVAP
jgi:hypothetical protein